MATSPGCRSGCGWSGASSPAELNPGQVGQGVPADRVHKGVSVPVHQPPLLSLAAEGQGDAERPVLRRQLADLAGLPLDDGQHGEVLADVRRVDVDGDVAAVEGPAGALAGLVVQHEAVTVSPAERRHQGEVVAVPDQPA